MKKLSQSLLMLAAFSSSLSAAEKVNLTDITQRYMQAKVAVQQKDSTKADIEHMVSFMKDNIQTEHKPHVTLQCENDGKGKDGFRQGLGYYLGKYESSSMKILDITEGQGMVSVKFDEQIKFIRDGKLQVSDSSALYILEFDGDLISREFRYDL